MAKRKRRQKLGAAKRAARRSTQGQRQSPPPPSPSPSPPSPPQDNPSFSIARASKREKRELGVAALVLLLCAAALFALSVDMRKARIAEHLQGYMGDHHQWITAHTILSANNWRAGEPWRHAFAMTIIPPSVELPALSDQYIYSSYPPGFVLPVYWLTLLSGKDAGPALMVWVSLASQFLVALLLSFTVLLLLRQTGFGAATATLLAATPPAIGLFTPAMYFHTSTYFADQAVLPWFALFVFLETARAHAAGRARAVINAAQAVVMFFGAFTDYLFWCVAFVVWLVRLWRGEFGASLVQIARRSAVFAAPALSAVAVFIAQVAFIGKLTLLWETMISRMAMNEPLAAALGRSTGAEKNFSEYAEIFWQIHVPQWLGENAAMILWGALALLVAGIVLSSFGKKPRGALEDALGLFACLLLPCFLQVNLLANHSGIHNFSTLKFTLPLAVLPALLPPILLHAYARFNPPITHKKMRLIQTALTAGVLAALLFWAVGLERANLLKGFPPVQPAWKSSGDFIAQNTDYYDVVFSPMFAVNMLPPNHLSYSRKRVYHATHIANIARKVKDMRGDFTVNVVLAGGQTLDNTPLRDLGEFNPDIIRSGEYTLYKIDGRVFLERVDS